MTPPGCGCRRELLGSGSRGSVFARHALRWWLVPGLPGAPTAAAGLDNYATHQTPQVKKWLLRHPRFHLHFTPTSSSWLNLIERWFAELTNRKLRRSAHRSVTELEADVRKWINVWNADTTPFLWTKPADQILDTLAAYCQRINDSDTSAHTRGLRHHCRRAGKLGYLGTALRSYRIRRVLAVASRRSGPSATAGIAVAGALGADEFEPCAVLRSAARSLWECPSESLPRATSA